MACTTSEANVCHSLISSSLLPTTHNDENEKIMSINQSKSRETEWKIRGEEKIEKNFKLSEREKKEKKVKC